MRTWFLNILMYTPASEKINGHQHTFSIPFSLYGSQIFPSSLNCNLNFSTHFFCAELPCVPIRQNMVCCPKSMISCWSSPFNVEFGDAHQERVLSIQTRDNSQEYKAKKVLKIFLFEIINS